MIVHLVCGVCSGICWLHQLVTSANYLVKFHCPPAAEYHDCDHRTPETMLVMEAITSKACQELICYETLETLGDAFLKFAVSVHLYRLFPRAHEGVLGLAICAS